MKKVIYLSLLVLFVPLAGYGREISKEEQEAVKTLEMIEASIRANMAAIDTWQGEVAYKNVRGSRKLDIELKFAIDNKNNSIYLSNKTLQSSMRNDFYYQVTVLTPEKYIQFCPNTNYGFGINHMAGKVAFIDPVEKAKHRESNDPRDLCTLTQTLSHNLTSSIETIKEHGFYYKGKRHLILNKTEKDGSFQYTFVSIGNTAKIEYVFDEKVGMNLIAYRMTDRARKWKRHYDLTWEEKNYIFLPKMIRQTDYHDDGSVSYSREFNFTKHVIDEELPPETFTLAKLGVKDGDRIVDNIQQKEFIYQAGELVDAPFETNLGDWNKPKPANTNPLALLYDQRMRLKRILKFGGISLLGILVIIIFFKSQFGKDKKP